MLIPLTIKRRLSDDSGMMYVNLHTPDRHLRAWAFTYTDGWESTLSLNLRSIFNAMNIDNNWFIPVTFHSTLTRDLVKGLYYSRKRG